MATTTNQKRGTKTAFVRQFALTVPVQTVLERAKQRGVVLSESNVYQARSDMRSKGINGGTPESAPTPSAPPPAPLPAPKIQTGLAQALRELKGNELEPVLKHIGVRLGYQRSTEILASLLEMG